MDRCHKPDTAPGPAMENVELFVPSAEEEMDGRVFDAKEEHSG